MPVVACVLGAALLTQLITPIYRAESKVQVNAAVIRPQDMDPFSGLFLSREAVASFVEIAKTPPILDKVAKNLELPTDSVGLGNVTARQIGKTEFFTVSVEHTNPVIARDAANELARVLKIESEVEWQRRVATSEMLAQFRLDELQQQIQSTRQALAVGAGDTQLLTLQLSQYESQYAVALRTLEESQLAGSRITEVLTLRAFATLPNQPISPNLLSNLMIGVLVGGLLGFGLIFFREYMDNKVKSPEEVSHLLGTPVIGALPIAPQDKDNISDEALLEPYHLLRTNLRFSWAQPGSRAILITSAEVGEGKTTILSNLGVALASAGQKVILIDADLRRPQIHSRFGVSRTDGLAELLEEDEPDCRDYLTETGIENLKMVTAGKAATNPSILLGSERMQTVLDVAKNEADVVLVDSPPVLYSSDALVLAGIVEQVLLVIWSGMLRGDTIQRARSALKIVKTRQLDVVLNKVRRETDAYAYYSYYYRDRYRSQDGE